MFWRKGVGFAVVYGWELGAFVPHGGMFLSRGCWLRRSSLLGAQFCFGIADCGRWLFLWWFDGYFFRQFDVVVVLRNLDFGTSCGVLWFLFLW